MINIEEYINETNSLMDNISSIKYPIVIKKEDAIAITENKTKYIGLGLNPNFKYKEDGYDDTFESIEGFTKINQLGDLYTIEEKNGKQKLVCLPKLAEMIKDFRKPAVDFETGEVYCDLPNSIFKQLFKKVPSYLKEEYKRVKKSGSRSKVLKWAIENNLHKKSKDGEMLSTGESTFCGQLHSKYIKSNRNPEMMVSLKFDNDIYNERHFIRARTINVGDTNCKKLDNAMMLMGMLVDFVLEKRESDVITRNKLWSYKYKPDFEPVELDLEFIEFWKNKINLIIKNSENIISKIDQKLEKIKFADGEILSPYKFYRIRQILFKNYIHSSKTMSVAAMDIDIDNNYEGYIKLCTLLEYLKEFNCYYVKNKLEYGGKEKLFHGSVYIVLDGRYKREDIDFIPKIFMLLGFNDLNHKFYTAKNPFNYEFFDLYKSNSKRNIFEVLADSSSLLHKSVNDIICSNYAIKELNLNIEDEKEDLFHNKILNTREAINKIYDKLKELRNLAKENRFFFYGDNYSTFHEIVLKLDNLKVINKLTYLNKEGAVCTAKTSDNVIKIRKDEEDEYWINGEQIEVNKIISGEQKSFKECKDLAFSNTCVYGRLKSLGYTVSMINLKEVDKKYSLEFIKVEDQRTKKKKEKQVLEENKGYTEVYSFVKNLKRRKRVKDLKKFKVELNSSRKTNIGQFAYLCGYSRKLFIKEMELINYIIENWEIRNDDEKYDNEKFKEIIQTAWREGRKQYEENKQLKKEKVNEETGEIIEYYYNEGQIARNSVKSKINGLKKDLGIAVMCYHNGASKRTLNRHLRDRRRNNPNKEVIDELFDNKFNDSKEIITEFFKKEINYTRLNKKEREEVNKYISKVVDDLVIFIEIELAALNKSVIEFSKIINEYFSLKSLVCSSINQFSALVA